MAVNKVANPANARLELGPKGLDLIRRWEGLRLQAYLDTEGIPTIGYGTTSATGIPVKLGMVVTRETAESYLATTVRKIYGAAVKRLVSVPLLQDEYDVLVSFVYNVGEARFASSTLLRKLNRGGYSAVPAELMKWVNSRSGNARKGLTARRMAEGQVWMNAGRNLARPFAAYSRQEYDAAERIGLPSSPDETPAPELVALREAPMPPSSDKKWWQSRTLTATAVAATSSASMFADQYETINGFLSRGTWFHYALGLLMLVSFAWIAYARLFKDQEAIAA